MPPPIAGTGAGPGMLHQFTGPALWSIIAGLVSIVVPFATNFYLPVLPLIGLFYGIQAIRRGRLLGGIVGIFLCAIGGVVALIASGLIFH